MYLLEVDPSQSRVHITLADHFDESQARALFKDLESRLKELQEGYSLLCDLTTLEKFEEAARPHFRKVMDHINATGVHKVIRIIPDPLNHFGVTLMSYFHYGSHVAVINCQTLKEALKHLRTS
jgi:hypothetical protein